MNRTTQEFRAYVLDHFKKWGLTKAECEIGILILRGFGLKEIAEARGTSETTLRQQALSLYKKASVEGRHQLSAYFLEQLLATPQEKLAKPFGRSGTDGL